MQKLAFSLTEYYADDGFFYVIQVRNLGAVSQATGLSPLILSMEN